MFIDICQSKNTGHASLFCLTDAGFGCSSSAHPALQKKGLCTLHAVTEQAVLRASGAANQTKYSSHLLRLKHVYPVALAPEFGSSPTLLQSWVVCSGFLTLVDSSAVKSKTSEKCGAQRYDISIKPNFAQELTPKS